MTGDDMGQRSDLQPSNQNYMSRAHAELLGLSGMSGAANAQARNAMPAEIPFEGPS
ncbi:MAG: hypothetical protein ACRDQ7_07995 [Haloechinothrix sp.]